jgi:iron complex outermembrane receptor protein
MKFVFRGVSGAALLLGLGGIQGAWAQQGTATPAPTAPQNQTVTTAPANTPANDRLVNAGPRDGFPAPQTTPAQPADQTATPADQTTGERVIVTGSLIATLPEDAPKPVEVYTAEDLKAQGQPSVSEFVRSLTVNYGSDLSFGQASQDVPTGAGFVNADLRGLGPNGTLVLMNGRRLATTNGGFGADLNTVPMEALQAVEVLKDGASTTYGAGAVGGVLNFRTRRDIDAPTITYERTLYDGSKGEYNFDFQTGWVGDAGNILMSFHYGHVDPMSQTKRDFSSLPFSVNPTVYSLNAPNPGRFHTSTNFHPGLPAVSASGAVNDLPGSTGAAATAACRAVGGEIVANLNNSTPTGTSTACALKQFYFQDIVNESDSYRFYGEANFDLSDTMEFTLSTTYSKGETIRHDIPTLAPINRATDAAVSAFCAASCQFVIPVQVQTYTQPNLTTAGTANGVFTRNPFIDDFAARAGVALTNNGAVYTAANWRPFGYGGNPLYGNGPKVDRQQRERILITTGLNGEFAGDTLLGQWLSGIKYDYSAQFNTYLDTGIRPDVSVARLQNALMGYGGFSCATRPTSCRPTTRRRRPSTAPSASRATPGRARKAASGSTRSPAAGRTASSPAPPTRCSTRATRRW